MNQQTPVVPPSSPMAMSIPAMLSRVPTAATLITDLQKGDLKARLQAVEQAPLVGTSLIVPLGRVMAGSDPAPARAALEALRRVVHHCARPGAAAERRTAAAELLKLTAPVFPRFIRAEAVYLLGCIGGRGHLAALTALTRDADLRDDAVMALARLRSGR